MRYVELKEYLTVSETKPEIIMNPNYEVFKIICG